MSENLGHHYFLPWARRGASNQIQEMDTLGDKDNPGKAIERPEIRVRLTIDYDGLPAAEGEAAPELQDESIEKTVKLTGPGDVVGINQDAIIRVAPAADVFNFEYNFLPYIEFFEEDFPWRYTPARPNGDKLRPWLLLLTLKDEEFQLTQAGKGLPFIQIADDAYSKVFPAPETSWALAHVHFNVEPDSDINRAVSEDPTIAFSRLFSSRMLQKNTAYTAFLLPAFETGRLAGLGQDPAGTLAQLPSWTAEPDSRPRPLDFPVYYQWRFGTGADGDFETLARKIQPHTFPVDKATRPMDIRDPGMKIFPGTPVLGLEGALRPPGFKPKAWPDRNAEPEAQQIADVKARDQLEQVMALTFTNPDEPQGLPDSHPYYASRWENDPVVLPPAYGHRHAKLRRFPAEAEEKRTWLRSLNLDFRYRAVAGYGSRMVRDHQEELMEQAWEQVGEVIAANRLVQEGRLAALVNETLLNKHLRNQKEDTFLAFTAPLHKLAAMNGQVLYHKILESGLPDATASLAFARALRPTTPLMKSLSAGSLQSFLYTGTLMNQLSAGNISFVPYSFHLSYTLSNDAINGLLGGGGTTGNSTVGNFTIPDSLATQISQLSEVLATGSAGAGSTIFSRGGLSSFPSGSRQRSLPHGVNYGEEMRNTLVAAIGSQAEGRLSLPLLKEQIAEMEARKEVKTACRQCLEKVLLYERILPQVVNIKVPDQQLQQLTGGPLRAFYQGKVLFTAPGASERDIAYVPSKKEEADAEGPAAGVRQRSFPVTLDLSQAKSSILQRLAPMRVLAERLRQRLQFPAEDKQDPLEVPAGIMKHPHFKQPVFDYLLQISKDLIIPNINDIPNDSLTLLMPNNHFIEAVLTGMNHEMARELLWREYPTDQRGTYFQKFWDDRDNLNPEAVERFDIPPISKWVAPLGENTLKLGNEEGSLVLVVRGELLRKYPNTLIYAHRASWIDGVRDLPEDFLEKLEEGQAEKIKFPLFQAHIEPDIKLLFFSLSAEMAKGVSPHEAEGVLEDNNPGWFFLFQERPGQVKLGLDITEGGGKIDIPILSINGFSWNHFIDPSQVENYHLDFKTRIQVTDNDETYTWGDHLSVSDAAQIASILVQSPVIIARHADDMLP